MGRKCQKILLKNFGNMFRTEIRRGVIRLSKHKRKTVRVEIMVHGTVRV